MHAFVTYDNTTNNPNNPNSPPVWVSYGTSTKSEMLVFSLSYVPYLPGDEDVSLLTGQPVTGLQKQPALLSAYPNPTAGESTVQISLPSDQTAVAQIIDPTGRVTKSNTDRLQLTAGENTLNADFTGLPPGIYIYRLITSSGVYNQKIRVEQ